MDAPEQMQQQPLSKKERRELRRQAKLEHREQSARKQTTQRLLVWGGVLAALALVVLGLIKLGSGGSYTSTYNGGLPPVTSDDWVTGSLIASTTLIEYGDFQCPACGSAEPFVHQLRQEFGNNVRFVYRQYPLPQHPLAPITAQAAEAAGKQNKFWEMHDRLFADQTSWTTQSEGQMRDTVTKYAQELGLNMDQFKRDLDSSEVKTRITQQTNDGTKAGVQSTPSFFLNGNLLQLSTFADLRNAIRQSLGQ
jgi:protein-disulfide isomerase